MAADQPSDNDVRLPLADVRVLDFGVVLAGPHAAMLLGDLGAEVIRVESIQHFAPLTRGRSVRPTSAEVRRLPAMSGGYPNRVPGERPWNRFPWFNATNRNKLGVTVDYYRESGRRVVEDLVRISDVFITNQTPGTLEKLGLGFDVLGAINPELIYIEASGFGSTGPYRSYRSMGPQMEAFAGHSWLKNPEAEDFKDVGGSTVAADAAASVAIALAATVGLLERVNSGKGQFIDVAMVESFLGLLGSQILESSINKEVHAPVGNRDYAAIQGCYPCTGDDQWVVLTVCGDMDWQGLCRAIDRPDLLQDTGLGDVGERYRQHDAIDEYIAAWTRKYDRTQVVSTLRANGVVAAPVLSDADAHADAHLRERGYFVEVEQADTGRFSYPGMPFRFTRRNLSVRLAPVCLGEHNEYVYKELLRYPKDKYDSLVREGHIGTAYLSDA